MGLDYSFHLGPYIKAINTMEDKEVFHKSCTNTKCENHRKIFDNIRINFCGICGNKIDKVSSTKEFQRVDCYDIVEGTDLNCLQDNDKEENVDIFVNNIKLFERDEGGDSKENSTIDITTEMITEELTAFNLKHATTIEKLKEAYGKENIEIKWGLIHYAW